MEKQEPNQESSAVNSPSDPGDDSRATSAAFGALRSTLNELKEELESRPLLDRAPRIIY